jgi:glycosyltransferase involved in cell wall biosynthesis
MLPVEIIVVAPSHVPMVTGGAERLWWGLVEHLNRATSHVADLVKLPSPERNFAEVIDSYRRFSELDLRHCDLVISTKYPSWMTRHPNHVCYMQHPLRGLYDTYPQHLPPQCELKHPSVRGLTRLLRGEEHSHEALAECFERVDRLRAPRTWRRPVPASAFAFPGPLVREIVQFCDAVAFAPGQIRRFCAISGVVANRDGYFPRDARVTAVPHPSSLTGYKAPRPGRYFFTVSRLDGPKRVDLLIEAVQRLRSDTELWIAGTGPEGSRLREMAGRDRRIRFLGYVDDPSLLELYADAIAVLFAPLDEDLGLVALEAMNAGKPVITTTDAGGTVELVRAGKTGLVAAPTPDALGMAMRRLEEDREAARIMGLAAREYASAVTWDRVTSVLLAGREQAAICDDAPP